MIYPDWPAPANVIAVATTRKGGVSRAPYQQLNLAEHVGDAPVSVANNRLLVNQMLGLPAEPVWLNQVHGGQVIDAAVPASTRSADASFSHRAAIVCAVLTADCLPVLICNRQGDRVAAAHAGWRGLAAGVLEATVEAMDFDPQQLLAWFGPAIGPGAFEVGGEVRETFVDQHARAAEAFTRQDSGRWLADIYQLARIRLASAGVTGVYGGGFCTVTQSRLFYSYRRESTTGRMASLIWFS